MAGEIETDYATGKTLYAVVRDATGRAWRTDTHVFEAYLTANLASYAVTMTEQGTASGYYAGDFPTQIGAGLYNVVAKVRAGGSPAEADVTAGVGSVDWTGTAGVVASAGRSLPAVAPAVANGLPILGINSAGIQISTLTGTALSLNSPDSPALNLTGVPGLDVNAVTGDAVIVNGHDTGTGMRIVGGSGGGAGLVLTRGSVASNDLVLTNSDAPSLSAAWGAGVVGNGRTRDFFLQGGMNKFTRSSSTITVYSYDDLAVLQSVAVTQDGTLLPVASVA